MEIKRGDVVTIAVSGDYGKPRPAVVIQNDAFSALNSVVVLRLTSDRRDWPLFRIPVEPTPENGLRQASDVMVDKPTTVPKARIGRHIGAIHPDEMRAVDAAFARFVGLVDC